MKCLFGAFTFFQKTKTSLQVVKSNLFFRRKSFRICLTFRHFKSSFSYIATRPFQRPWLSFTLHRPAFGRIYLFIFTKDYLTCGLLLQASLPSLKRDNKMIVILSGHFFLTKNTHSSKEIRYNFRISKWPDHTVILEYSNIKE